MRYWETQFPSLRPVRTAGGQRHYKQAQIDEGLRIKAMVHEQGYRLAAAKRAVRAVRTGRTAAAGEHAAAPADSREATLRDRLLAAIGRLEKVLDDDEKDV